MTDRAAIDARLEAAQRELSGLQKEIERLKIARSVLEDLHAGPIPSAVKSGPPSTLDGLTPAQQVVYRHTPLGYHNRQKPGKIVEACKVDGVDPAYVRTTLWRMADGERISAADGYYWRRDARK